MSIIKSLKSVAIASLAILIPSIAFAAGGNLEPNDPVGITFWLISIAMVAATVFFLMESLRVDGKWRTSMVVGGLVTLVAAVHYFYMREVWVATGASPTVFRYVDWLITVPLQMIEFYLILAACTAIARFTALCIISLSRFPYIYIYVMLVSWRFAALTAGRE